MLLATGIHTDEDPLFPLPHVVVTPGTAETGAGAQGPSFSNGFRVDMETAASVVGVVVGAIAATPIIIFISMYFLPERAFLFSSSFRTK